MGGAARVGRFGGCALTLGIGAALVSGHGIAHADSSTDHQPGTPTSDSAGPRVAQDRPEDSTSQDPDGGQPAAEPPAEGPDSPGDAGIGRTRSGPREVSHQDEEDAGSETVDPPVRSPHDHWPNDFRPRTATNRSVATDGEAVDTTATGAAPPSQIETAVAEPRGPQATPSADGDAPAEPPDSPATWAVLAAARRESFVESPALTSVADAVTTGQDAGTSEAAETADDAPLPAATTHPAKVVAIAQTAPLEFLQRLPIVGPLIVGPIVWLIHQIPVISDLLHPWIGYPLRPDVPSASPVPRDVKVTSFDGTQIYVHLMPASGLGAEQRAPSILFGPAMPLPGQTNLDGTPLDGILVDNFGLPSIAALRNADYNVVTWDPRGEYNSGGQVQLDSPDYEARDVSAIISWLAAQPEAKLDGDPDDLDPRIGMVGASYGGGIQLVTAAIDHRVDAIVPTIAWHSLTTSLYKNSSFKSSQSILGVLLVLTGARVAPWLFPAAIEADITGTLNPADEKLLADRGPGDLVEKITAPTLLIQGTVDTGFGLQEADDTATALIANEVPTKVLWFCGGHGTCSNNLFDPTDGTVITQRTLQWLARYVRGDETTSTGPQFEWVDQRGRWYSLDRYPAPAPIKTITARREGGTLALIPVIGGSGIPFVAGASSAANALTLTIPPVSATTYVVGAPQLSLTYSGSGSATHVYAQLVDGWGAVIGSQVTPVPVTLDGDTHTVTVALEQVAQTLLCGQQVTLQLVASAGTYQTIIPAFGTLRVAEMELTLPTVEPRSETH